MDLSLRISVSIPAFALMPISTGYISPLSDLVASLLGPERRSMSAALQLTWRTGIRTPASGNQSRYEKDGCCYGLD